MDWHPALPVHFRRRHAYESGLTDCWVPSGRAGVGGRSQEILFQPTNSGALEIATLLNISQWIHIRLEVSTGLQESKFSSLPGLPHARLDRYSPGTYPAYLVTIKPHLLFLRVSSKSGNSAASGPGLEWGRPCPGWYCWHQRSTLSSLALPGLACTTLTLDARNATLQAHQWAFGRVCKWTVSRKIEWGFQMFHLCLLGLLVCLFNGIYLDGGGHFKITEKLSQSLESSHIPFPPHSQLLLRLMSCISAVTLYN